MGDDSSRNDEPGPHGPPPVNASAGTLGMIIGVLIVICSPGSSLAQKSGSTDTAGQAMNEFRELSSIRHESDWTADHVRIERMIDSLFENEGWDSESDRFARSLALDVSKIPPWRPLERINRLHEGIAKRYHLTDASALQVKALMLKETGRFLLQHGPLVLRQLREGMETRASKKPITAEQVARWMQQSAPILAEAVPTMKRVCDEVRPLLNDEAKQLLDRDFESFQKRHKTVARIAGQWAAGKWTPEDWGLQDDPIQRGMDGAERLAESKEMSPSQPPIAPPTNPSQAKHVNDLRAANRPGLWSVLPACTASDPSSWDQCVDDFAKTHDLDAGQVSTAESILHELQERAEDYLRTVDKDHESSAAASKKSDGANDPVRSIFAELNARLDAILTSSQRAKSER